MAEMVVPGIPDDDLAALNARAERHGRSAEEEARDLIQHAAREERVWQDLSRAASELESRLLRDADGNVQQPAPARARRYRRVEPTPHRPAR
ncbi:MAG: FitA-like ribbon-helix-helix domain-containing protein [Longimicrobiales bacterium]